MESLGHNPLLITIMANFTKEVHEYHFFVEELRLKVRDLNYILVTGVLAPKKGPGAEPMKGFEVTMVIVSWGNFGHLRALFLFWPSISSGMGFGCPRS